MKTNEIYKLKSLFTDYHNNLSVPMIRLFGLDTAVLFSEIYSQWRIKQKKDKYIDRIHLYVASTQFNTGLSPVRQRKALETLSNYGIISVMYYGFHRRRVVRLNADMFDMLKNDLEKDKEKVNDFIESQKAVGTKNREIIEQKRKDYYGDNYWGYYIDDDCYMDYDDYPCPYDDIPKVFDVQPTVTDKLRRNFDDFGF